MGQPVEEQHKPIPASQRDQQSPVWDMSQERVISEQLTSQRFNFFVIFFSLVIAGAINAKQQWQLQSVLTLGSIFCILLARVLRRTQEKFDLVLEDLFTDPTHPATIINKRADPNGSVRRIISIWIPTIACITLLLGALLAAFGVILAQ